MGGALEPDNGEEDGERGQERGEEQIYRAYRHGGSRLHLILAYSYHFLVYFKLQL